MIRADRAIVGLDELATPRGASAQLGAATGRLHLIQDAAIAFDGETIAFVGERERFEAEVALDGERIDGRGKTALPGFVDCHTHLPFAGWRETEFDERQRGVSYSEIAARGGGILSSVAMTRRATLDELTTLSIDRLDRMAASGTTTVEAKSGYGLSFDDELKQLDAIRRAGDAHRVEVIPTCLAAHTVPADFRPDRRAEYLAMVQDRLLPEVVERGLAEYADIFIDPNAFTPDEARSYLRRAGELGLKTRVHADQLADDGGSIVAAEAGASSADHLEYISEAGIAALRESGTVAVLLPAVTLFLKMAVQPPGRRLIDAGLPLALATDFNPGSCPTDSMPTVIWIAALTAGMSVDEAITAATLNAAASLERAERIGSLEVGKRADVVLLDAPNRYHLVYRFGSDLIDQVFVAGRRHTH